MQKPKNTREWLIRITDQIPIFNNWMEQEQLVNHLIECGVVVLDMNVISPENRPLITHFANMPLNDVLELIKNKADVVPVVRCSQCRKRYTTECALWFSQLDDKQYFCGAIHNDDFYCSYGERK